MVGQSHCKRRQHTVGFCYGHARREHNWHSRSSAEASCVDSGTGMEWPACTTCMALDGLQATTRTVRSMVPVLKPVTARLVISRPVV